MDRVVEHFRFGPIMMNCDLAGISNFINKIVVRGGQSRRISLCSGCHKEVICDANIPGSYNPGKPHVSGNVFTIHPEIIYYPIKRTDNLVFGVNLNKPIPLETRIAVSELTAINSRMAS